jgi:hypothetical protein
LIGSGVSHGRTVRRWHGALRQRAAQRTNTAVVYGDELVAIGVTRVGRAARALAASGVDQREIVSIDVAIEIGVADERCGLRCRARHVGDSAKHSQN